MEERDAVKEYFDILYTEDRADTVLMMQNVFWDMDWLIKNMGMVFSDARYFWERAAELSENKGKPLALQAFHEALKGFLPAQEHFTEMNRIVENGIKKTVERHKGGKSAALEKPFPVLAAEQEIRDMKECLGEAFIPIDICIGRIEETEGMKCENGHYWDTVRGGLWEGGAGEQTLLDVLWPMRSLEKVMIQADEAAVRAANRIDELRDKAHTVTKLSIMAQGYFWEREKEKQGGYTENAHIQTGTAAGRTVVANIPPPKKKAVAVGMMTVAEKVAAPGKVSEQNEADGWKKEKRDGGERKTSLRDRLESAKEKAGECNAQPVRRRKKAGRAKFRGKKHKSGKEEPGSV